MTDRAFRFRSPDARFGLEIRASAVERLIELCSTAGGEETGGILIGFYTPRHDVAIATAISAPPSDSVRHRTWFVRGTKGLRKRLEDLWRVRGQYYLGEWHFHPEVSPDPSGQDEQQLCQIASDLAAQCPEPILVIVGGHPPERWTVRAFVFPRGARRVELGASHQRSEGGGASQVSAGPADAF